MSIAVRFLLGVEILSLLLLASISAKKIKKSGYNAQVYIGNVLAIVLAIIITLLGNSYVR